jgi:hypothetical protein
MFITLFHNLDSSASKEAGFGLDDRNSTAGVLIVDVEMQVMFLGFIP